MFLAALATLLLELLDSRLLSVLTWYHLSFFAVSLAMLGMASGAVHVFLGGDRYRGDGLRQRLPRICLLLGAAIPVTHGLNLILPIPDLSSVVFALSAWDVASVALSTTVLTVPFFLSGIVITAGLTRTGGRIGFLYGADLLGAAAGSLLVIPLLEFANISSAIFAAGAAAVAAALCFQKALAVPRLAGARALLLLLLVACAANAFTDRGVGVLRAKGHDVRPGPGERAVWNAHSFVFVSRPYPDRMPWYWGPGEGAKEQRVTWAGMNIDGAAASPLTRWNGDVGELEWTRYDVSALPYQLRSGDVLVVGVGGGRDILAALASGATSITGVEVNRSFLDILRESHRDFAGIAQRPDVHLVHAEARSWLTRHPERYDVLQMSLIDTWAATGAGAFTLTENGLYTLEAWRLFLSRLNPGGLFSVSRFFDPNQVSETTRLVALAVAALLDRGVQNPADHLALVAREVVATLLLSPDPLAPSDLDELNRIADRYGYQVLLAPGIPPPSAQLGAIVASGSAAELAAAVSDPDYDYTPPTDGRPYFFNLLKLGSFARVRDASLGVVAGNVRATATLLVLFGLALVLVAIIVGWPLLRAGRPAMDAGSLASSLAYFSAIGAGFMWIQIPFLQSFSVYLGHPTLSYAVILFSMVSFTGLGSLASERVALDGRWRLFLPVAIAVATLGLARVLPAVLAATAAFDTPVRCLVVVGIVAPLSALLGLCFPLGMRLVERISPDASAWMWGANGACGVLASIAAVAISLSFGIRANFLLAAALYLSLLGSAAALAARARAATAVGALPARSSR